MQVANDQIHSHISIMNKHLSSEQQAELKRAHESLDLIFTRDVAMQRMREAAIAQAKKLKDSQMMVTVLKKRVTALNALNHSYIVTEQALNRTYVATENALKKTITQARRFMVTNAQQARKLDRIQQAHGGFTKKRKLTASTAVAVLPQVDTTLLTMPTVNGNSDGKTHQLVRDFIAKTYENIGELLFKCCTSNGSVDPNRILGAVSTMIGRFVPGLDGCSVATADGVSRFIRKTVSCDTLRDLRQHVTNCNVWFGLKHLRPEFHLEQQAELDAICTISMPAQACPGFVPIVK